MLIFFNGWVCCSAVPAAAQGPAALMEKPGPEKAKEEKKGEKKEAAPTTCGPLISDGCIPIEEHHASLQVLTALSFYPGLFSPNWRYRVPREIITRFSCRSNLPTALPKTWRCMSSRPSSINWVNNVDRSVAGPNGERSASYAGIGDITTVAKYLLLEESEIRPAVTGGGRGWPVPPATPTISTRAFLGHGCRRHRGFHFHHRRQPVQMAEAVSVLQQYLVEQPS